MIAIQDELTTLTAQEFIDLEYASSTLTTSNGARVYSMPSDFVRFADYPFFYRGSTNYLIYEYPGGRQRLRREIPNYQSQAGQPNWWYWERAASKKVAFYQVPDGAYTLTFEYQRSVYVSLATDYLPFELQEEADTFCDMASRRFKYMFERADNVQYRLDQDMMYQSARSTLYNLMQPRPPRKTYGRAYV